MSICNDVAFVASPLSPPKGGGDKSDGARIGKGDDSDKKVTEKATKSDDYKNGT